MGGTCGWPALPLPVLTRLTMLSDAQRRAHQQRADAPKVLCQPIEAVGVPRQLARDGRAARHALRARRLEDLGARVARQCGPAAALPPQRDLCRKQACSVFGQLAPRWLLPASDHTPGCPRLRPASASHQLGPRWHPGHTGLVLHTVSLPICHMSHEITSARAAGSVGSSGELYLVGPGLGPG